MIIMVRADDRLIHGMVAVSWTSHLQPQTILVANNVAAKDSFKAMTMKMAKPAGVNLVIKSLDDSIKALNNPINVGYGPLRADQPGRSRFKISDRI